VPRTSHTASTVGDRIYIIGGDNTWRRVDVFDPATTRWSTMGEAPEDFRGHAAAVVDGKIYVVGGEERGICTFKKSCWEYDPSTDTWSHKADRPFASTGLSAVSLNGKVIAIGGKAAGGPQPGAAGVHSFDPVSNTWTPLCSLPAPTGSSRAAVVGGKVFLFMGVHDDRESLDTLIYDPLKNTWDKGVDQPRRRWLDTCNTCTVAGSDQIYIVSGSARDRVPYSEVDILDCSQGKWRLGPPFPSPRASHAVAVHGDKIYVFGGRNPSGTSASVYSFQWRK
jgi:N-acetylneuraminic acid mutarotase